MNMEYLQHKRNKLKHMNYKVQQIVESKTRN